MTEESGFLYKAVKVQELKDGMVILAYSGFNKKFQPMDETTCKFIRHNFGLAKAVVIRNYKKLNIPVKEIKAGDALHRLHHFPPGLNKLTTVNNKLAKALHRRGFTKFNVKQEGLERAEKKELKDAIDLVKQNSKSPTSKKEKLKVGKEKAEKFVHELKDNLETRKKASKAVENIMDNARVGRIDYGEIEIYVNEIAKHSSSEAMSAIMSLKESNQTYDHCVDVGVIFQSSYYNIKERKGETGIFQTKTKALLGAFLHDFGKSKIPKDILDSTVRFERESQEMKMMESHPYFGAKLLSDMDMPDAIINMAHYHHVKQDTTMNSCYPKNINFNKVIPETRLLSIIDAYQALVGRRKYKKSWNLPAAIRYLDALAGVEFDMDIWDDFLQVMGLYPKGSLVELSDKSIGFVMSVPEENLERPQIAVVRSASGEDLSSHSLIDLEFEKDISIAKDLDIEETFGANAINIFTNIKIS